MQILDRSKINLSEAEVVLILPKVARGLEKYLWIQSQIAERSDYHCDPIFRRRFNGFYRVRRGAAWQNTFYDLMAIARGWPFAEVLNRLSSATGRLEISFASKLVASLDPSFPVIDSFVLKNVGLKLPLAGSADRLRKASEIYETLRQVYREFLESPDGGGLVREFRRFFPMANVTEMKMLDLVLWQKRA